MTGDAQAQATREAARLCVDATGNLPDDDVSRMAEALARGPVGLRGFRARCGSGLLRQACSDMLDAVDGGADPVLVAGVLAGIVQERSRRRETVDVVWSGPDVDGATGRLTSAAVVDLIDSAREELLIVGYAVHDEPRVQAALDRVAQRQVAITLLVERTEDNDSFNDHGRPAFPDLSARRLVWPRHYRPTGASLHAKMLVADRQRALLGSANITSAALNRNLECGVLLTEGGHARQLADHVDELVRSGQLQEI